MNLTEEQKNKIALLRLLVGDTERSPFYPVLEDEEYAKMLEFVNWDVEKAILRTAQTIAFLMVTVNTRERTGDIEVWNNASSEYRKALETLINKPHSYQNLPSKIAPYAAGISRLDVCGYFDDPDVIRSPLSQISPCISWLDKMENFPCGHNYLDCSCRA